jgi:hypothetical protein
MNTGAQFNMLEARLSRLQQRVRQVELAALGSGQSPGAGAPGDPTTATRYRRLAGEFTPILRELESISRRIDQIEGFLDLKDRIAIRLSRDQRYSARQSVRDLQAQGRDLYQLIDDIRADVDKIVVVAGAPTERERIELINSAMDSVSQFAGHMHEAQALLSRPAGSNIAVSHLTVNVSLPGLLLTTYVLALYLVRKWTGRGETDHTG